LDVFTLTGNPIRNLPPNVTIPDEEEEDEYYNDPYL
jgi:hypothetical protein